VAFDGSGPPRRLARDLTAVLPGAPARPPPERSSRRGPLLAGAAGVRLDECERMGAELVDAGVIAPLRTAAAAASSPGRSGSRPRGRSDARVGARCSSARGYREGRSSSRRGSASRPSCPEVGTLREARTGLTRPGPRGPLIYNFAPRAVQDKDKESREWIQVGQPAAMAFPAVAIH